jgi:hypothetical protein
MILLLEFCCIVSQATFWKVLMSTLAREERVELAQRFAPRLLVFPEKQELGKPKITGGAGSGCCYYFDDWANIHEGNW